MRISDVIARQRERKQQDQGAVARLAAFNRRRALIAEQYLRGGVDSDGVVHPPMIHWLSRKDDPNEQMRTLNDWAFVIITTRVYNEQKRAHEYTGEPAKPLNYWTAFACVCGNFCFTFDYYAVSEAGRFYCGPCADKAKRASFKGGPQRQLARKKPWTEVQTRMIDFIGTGVKTEAEICKALSLSPQAARGALNLLNRMGDLLVTNLDAKGYNGTWTLKS